jgi:hypothetical protein
VPAGRRPDVNFNAVEPSWPTGSLPTGMDRAGSLKSPHGLGSFSRSTSPSPLAPCVAIVDRWRSVEGDERGRVSV